MSMGYDNNTRGKNGNNDVREPYVYSNIKMRNPQSTVDQCALNFQFMYGLLNIYLAPKKEDSNGDYINYDYDKKIAIWLSYSHAKIFAKEIRRLLDNDNIVKLKDNTKIAYNINEISLQNDIKGMFVKKVLEKYEANLIDKETMEKVIEYGLEVL